MSMAGVDEYYGMTEYGNDADYDGWWGIWDHKFLPFTAGKINEFNEPFVSVTFSLSSHHPFSVPQEYQEKFKGGPVKLQRCIQYADFSLREFFKKASQMPWYKNTLFVITADHTSLSQFPEYKSNSGLYSVPIIFFKPDHTLKGMDQTIVHHADVMPTILDYLNYDDKYVAFGRSAFKKDRMCANNIMASNPEVVGTMETRIKAIVQQYNNRLIENRLQIKEQAPILALKKTADQ
jgi:phosphoglycerol transferase MdoB-like AlkP superfamily enzyme